RRRGADEPRDRRRLVSERGHREEPRHAHPRGHGGDRPDQAGRAGRAPRHGRLTMPIELPPAAFVWSLFAVTTLGALLRLSFENREDHFVLTIAATVDAALLGRWSLALVWGSVLLAMPMVLAWSFVP